MGLLERIKILDSIRNTGYAYWQVLMRDGRIINEWDMNWSELPRGKSEARLVCPNGKLPTVCHPSGSIDGRVFHFNISHMIAGGERATTSYVLGLIHGTNGESTVFAWEPFENRLVGPFQDNFFKMNYGGPVAQLDALLQGVPNG